MAQAFDDTRGLVSTRHSIKGTKRLGGRDSGALQILDDGIYSVIAMVFGLDRRAVLLVFAEERAASHG
ncbi:hypothetical protein RRF57_008088 [Xylaria bambusicola]|uniref:Uncharacterized protein n=1 Tax=Xylaria bambusicola TaxID=326684 RepID=A0AAN7V1B9_9PEZI